MIPLSASKVWFWVQRDGGLWGFPTWTKSHLSLHRHPEVSLEVVEETLLILQENLREFLLELGGPVSRWVFSVPDFLQEVWFVHLRLKKMNFPFSFGEYYFLCIESFRVDFRCVHRFRLLNVCNQYVTLPNSLREQCVSEKQSQVRLSFQIDGFLTGLSQR